MKIRKTEITHRFRNTKVYLVKKVVDGNKNYFLKGLYETKLFSCHSVFYPYGLSAYQNFDSCV